MIAPFFWDDDGILTAIASGLAAVDQNGDPIVWVTPEFKTLPPNTLPTFLVTVAAGAAAGRVTIQARDAQEALTVLTDDHDLGADRLLITVLASRPTALTVTVEVVE